MPDWVTSGYQTYAQRMPRECELVLKEIPAGRRRRNEPPTRAIAEEGDRLLAAIPANSQVLALDERGEGWRTRELAERMRDWFGSGRDVALLVGGPDGLSESCLKRSERRWSLSPLTLPHPLVRVLLAEQLYRAISLIKGHPYHRE